MLRLIRILPVSMLIAGLSLIAASSAQAEIIIIGPAPSSTNPYVEILDAGDRNNPQLIPTGLNEPYDGFTGDIGGADSVDAFGFGWAGGDFSATAAFDNPVFVFYEVPCDCEPMQELLDLALLAADGTVIVGPSTSMIGPTFLNAGNYILEVSTTYFFDPSFTVGVTNAVAFPVLPFAVPEPTTLALFALGLAGLGYMRRRRAA